MRSAHSASSQIWGLSSNKSLQRAALTIKCLAAGVDTLSASHLLRARVLTGQPAVAELGR
jgi:hypothetical protein